MRYEIITKKSVYGNNVDLYEEQGSKLDKMGYKLDEEYTIHFFESKYFSDCEEVCTINDAIESLAIKDGADLVRWENGNIGFVAYYNGNKNGFEIR